MHTPHAIPLRQGRTVVALITAAGFATTLCIPASFAVDSPARPAAANAAAKKPGTAKPIVGDILDGTNIRKKPGAGAAATQHPGAPKPIIGDILEGTNIRKKPGNGANATKPTANQAKGQRRIESPRDSASGLATGK